MLNVPICPSASCGKPPPTYEFQSGHSPLFSVSERKYFTGKFNCQISLWPKSGVEKKESVG